MSAYIPVTAHQPTWLSNFACCICSCISWAVEMYEVCPICHQLSITPTSPSCLHVLLSTALFVEICIPVVAAIWCQCHSLLFAYVNCCNSLSHAIAASAAQNHACMSPLLGENGCADTMGTKHGLTLSYLCWNCLTVSETSAQFSQVQPMLKLSHWDHFR